MAYRLIYTDFWTDPKVMEEMTPEDKMFYLYILTNPRTTSCGIYMITKKQMSFELGYSIETVNNLMTRFEKSHKLICYNPETRELAIKNWGKYNLSRGGKPVLDCLCSELSKVKDKSLILYVEENIKSPVLRVLYKNIYHSSNSSERFVPPHVDNTDTSTNTKSNTFTEINTNDNTNTETNDYINTNTDAKMISKAEPNENSKEIENKNAQTLSLSIIQEYEKITGEMGALNLGAVKIAVMCHGHSNVKKAINKALEKGKLNMPYINGILRTWAKEGYPREGDYDGNRCTIKNIKSDTSEFTGFRPQEPRTLTEEERNSVEGELL